MKNLLCLSVVLAVASVSSQCYAQNSGTELCPGRPSGSAHYAGTSPVLELLYTARLLGYARCDDRTDIAKDFIDYMRASVQDHPGAIVVGMGDNLAPEYASRFDKSDFPLERLPKTLTNDPIVRLFNAYYDVVVPGKEDFYFGADRLAATAAAAKAINASNLTITAHYTVRKPDPNERPPLDYVSDHPDVKLLDDGHIVFQRNHSIPTYSIAIEKSEKNISLKLCDADETSNCADFGASVHETEAKENFRVITWSLASVKDDQGQFPKAGSRKMVCIYGLHKPDDLSEKDWTTHAQRYCHPVSVDALLFPNYPYSIVQRGETKYVFIAAVDPNIEKQLPPYNRSWGPHADDSRVQEEVAFLDPEASIRQAYYEALTNGDCGGSRVLCEFPIVVLAQMASDAAGQLADNLSDISDFELMLSRGNGQGSAFGSNMDFISAGNSLPVITPRSIYVDDGSLLNPIHLLQLNSDKTVNHIRKPSEKTGLGDSVWRAAQANQDTVLDGAVHQAGSRDLRHFLVEQMRTEYGADAALMSQREVFTGQAIPNTASMIEKTERLVWEGAHITILRISGAKLKEVLDKSHDAPDDHKLIMSGIRETDDKHYWIDGRPLDEKNGYYKVAAPEALAFGDPNYGSLSDETFAVPEVEQEMLSYLVCEKLDPKGICINELPIRAQYRPEVVFSFSPGLTFKNYALSVVAPDHHDPVRQLSLACQRHTQNCDEHEIDWQFRRLFFAKLLNTNVSYSLSKAHPNDQVVGTKFAGVTDPRVVQAHSEVYSFAHDLQVGFTTRTFTVGIEDVVAFGRSRQGNLSGGKDSVSLTNNTGTVGPYFEWGFHHTSAPYWRLILRPADFTSNFSRTMLSFSGAKDSAGNPTSFTENLPAQRSLAPKAGLRYEAPQRKDSLDTSDGNAFLEFGFKSTWNLNLPSVLLLNPGPSQTSCRLDSSVAVGDCIAAVAAVQPNAVPTDFTKNRQNGGYWTMAFHFPLTKRFTYKMSSNGEINPGGRFTAETFYAATFDNYLETQIWGNFSLAPHFGMFFYENQGQGQALQRHTVDIALTYSFNWHHGLGWKAFFTNPETSTASGN